MLWAITQQHKGFWTILDELFNQFPLEKKRKVPRSEWNEGLCDAMRFLYYACSTRGLAMLTLSVLLASE
jgi:hypothetical protein